MLVLAIWRVSDKKTVAPTGLRKIRFACALAAEEAPVERAVTNFIASMSFLWLDVDDEPGPKSQRGVIERNAIALLSNYQRPVIDPPSPDWLGNASSRSLVRGSGLWNQRHVEEAHDPAFLVSLEMAIERTAKGSKQFR
jgi:hypothetical protein